MGILLSSGGGGSVVTMVIIYAAIFAAFYFLLIRPQRKEKKRVEEMRSAMAVGDTVVTTSGFYGVLIDITDEDVIVEFGNNKNCRIPMQKAAIAVVEKASDADSSQS